MRYETFGMLGIGLILACSLTGCGGGKSTTAKPAQRAVIPTGPEEPDVEEALARLEGKLTATGRNEFSSEIVLVLEENLPPAPSAHELLMVGSGAYLSSLDYRHALAAFQRAQALDANLADPLWGRGVVLYNLAILDMVSSGAATIEKGSPEAMERIMASQSFRRREALLLSKGFSAFSGVRSAMEAQGWNEKEAVGGQVAALIGAPGTPASPGLVRWAKQTATALPLVTFKPNASGLALLRLADAQFRQADSLPGAEGARHRFFFRADIGSVHQRIRDLLSQAAP